MELFDQSQKSLLEEIHNENNIENWMKENLPQNVFIHYNSNIPSWLEIHGKTWYNYRKCHTPVPHNILLKLKIIFSPWNCTLEDLVKPNNNNNERRLIDQLNRSQD